MTDDSPDLDALLAASARGVRPDPAFEEDLLLRIDEELATAAEIITPAPVDLAPHAPRRRRRARVLARAALVLLIAGAAVGIAISIAGEDRSTRTGLPEPVATILGDACAAHLPSIAPYAAVDRLPPQAGQDEWQQTAVPDLRAATDGFAEALDSSTRAVTDADGDLRPLQELAATLQDIDDDLAEEEVVWNTGFRTQAEHTVPLIARHLNELADGIADLGVSPCRPLP